MTFTEHRHANGVTYLTAPVISARHAFTTRLGGVSTGALSSLNLSRSRETSPDAVRENYRRLGEATGIDTAHMAFTQQVHGAAVRVVTDADARTPVAYEANVCKPVPYEADGLVTNVPGLALICFTADCVPVLLCDALHGVAAAVHCGWRSSVQDILGVALEKMRALGADPETTAAAIGQAISRCCFEVGEEVTETAAHWLGGDLNGLYTPREGVPGKYLLDLKGANARRLTQLGLRAERIAVSDDCTFCLPQKYWSHRYTHGNRGAQGALIVL